MGESTCQVFKSCQQTRKETFKPLEGDVSQRSDKHFIAYGVVIVADEHLGLEGVDVASDDKFSKPGKNLHSPVSAVKG